MRKKIYIHANNPKFAVIGSVILEINVLFVVRRCMAPLLWDVLQPSKDLICLLG